MRGTGNIQDFSGCLLSWSSVLDIGLSWGENPDPSLGREGHLGTLPSWAEVVEYSPVDPILWVAISPLAATYDLLQVHRKRAVGVRAVFSPWPHSPRTSVTPRAASSHLWPELSVDVTIASSGGFFLDRPVILVFFICSCFKPILIPDNTTERMIPEMCVYVLLTGRQEKITGQGERWREKASTPCPEPAASVPGSMSPHASHPLVPMGRLSRVPSRCFLSVWFQDWDRQAGRGCRL